MQIPPIIPESTGSGVPAQRKDGAAINGVIQLVAGLPTLPRADPRLATIVVPPTLQLSEAAVTADRDRRVLVEGEALARSAKADQSGLLSDRLVGKPNTGGLALDLAAWLKQLSRQSNGPIRWPVRQADPSLARDPFVDVLHSVKPPISPEAKINSPPATSLRGRSEAPIQEGAKNLGIPVDVRVEPKPMNMQSSGQVGLPVGQADLSLARDSSVDVLHSVKSPISPEAKINSPQATSLRGRLETPIEDAANSLSPLAMTTAQERSLLPSRGDEVRVLMSALVQGLALSNLFAARNLAGWITGERLRNRNDALQERTGEVHPVATREVPAENSDLISGVPRKLVDQWMKAIDIDSRDALETAQLLLNGKLIWQGQLSDGTQVLLQRYDVWREPKKQREPMERGVGISIETELKSRGRLRIDGRQWRDALEIVVTGDNPNSPPDSWHGWQDLVARLKQRIGATVISRVADSSGEVVDVG